MKYENIFPTGILIHDVPSNIANEVEELVVSRIDQLQRPDDNAPHATDYFERDKIIDLKYDTPNLYSEIDMCVRDYQNKNAMNRINEGYGYNYWTQDYKEGDIHSEHHHNVGQISGVYYVRANESAGGISFRNPNPFTEYGHTMRDTAPYSWQEYVYKPVKGRILLFPSYLKHTALPSGKNCVRSVIAFNVTSAFPPTK
jgi:uncharacterized protein (TIGR02466 family)|tara:strand:+ start:8938 stop:9534 length:597 start_codon:yes stop_codon:yes gene_type:complete